jgi:hypothetical protein
MEQAKAISHFIAIRTQFVTAVTTFQRVYQSGQYLF